jgi:hypothetical protein
MAALGVRVPRARYLRRRHAERGHRRGRLRRLNRWCDARADTSANGGIGDTAAAPAAVTATNATETINHGSHGFDDGSGPHLIAASVMPVGLDPLRPYFLNVTGAGTYTLARDHFHALGGAGGPEPFTTDGTTVTSEVGANSWCFFAYLKSRVHPLVIQAATDIDDIKL